MSSSPGAVARATTLSVMFGDHVNYAYVAMTHPARLELMLSSQASPGRGAAHFREVE